MRAMTGRHTGAEHIALRAFYVHAVRPIVDYISVALTATKPRLRERLETVRNEALSIILDTPRSTKVLIVLMEANLFPLDFRIDIIAS